MYQNQILSIQEEALLCLLKQDRELYKIIESVSALRIPALYVGGGSIAQTVWNHLFAKPIGYGISDVDIVYCDATLNDRKDRLIKDDIISTIDQSNYAIDITNEAKVHLWYKKAFGFQIPPYSSTEEAISTWPSTATSIGVYLDKKNELQLFAPYGLSDLFAGILRPNKTMISQAIYEEKVQKWRSKWPDLRVIDW